MTQLLTGPDPAIMTPDFSDTPWWLSLVKALMIFVILLLNMVIVIWAERRIVGRMQWRLGPNRFGPFGILQTLGDGVKLMTKEDFIPAKADKVMYLLAPVITGSLAWFSWAVIPMGPNHRMFGHSTPLQLMDAPVAILLVLALAGVGAYGILLAGWSSGSTYPLLGGLRSSAQVISYEIAMGLAIVAVVIYSQTMSTSGIVAAQTSMWHILPAFVSFVIYVITMVGETNRIPFDLAEGEGELTGGFHTEYTSMRFAMFYLGEYINMMTVSALAATLFLGGWMAPWPLRPLFGDVVDHYYLPFVWFFVKMWTFLFFFIWLRAVAPRVRYDQFMRLGWKVLIPVSVFWVMFVAFMRAARTGLLGEGRLPALVVGGVGVTLAVVAIYLVMLRNDRASAAKAAALAPPAQIDPFAGGYPVPPMPGQTLLERGRPTSPELVVSTTQTETEADRG